MPESWHGTNTGYTNRGCRCEACCEAARAYRRARVCRAGPAGAGPAGTLADAIIAHDAPGEYVRVPFPARLEDQDVVVTAVLQRTAVYHAGDICDRRLTGLHLIQVDPAVLEWVVEPENSRRLSAARGRRMAHISLYEMARDARQRRTRRRAG